MSELSEEARLAQIKRDSDEIYRSLGEFAVKFEHACHAIQRGIVFLLQRAGIENQQICQIVIAGMTADPARTMYESLLNQMCPQTAVEKKIVKDLLNRFQDLTYKRNDVIHGLWFVGWAGAEDTEAKEARGLKFHKNSAGTATKSMKQSHESLALLIKEAEALASLFSRLNGYVVFGESFEKQFNVSSKGFVTVPDSV